MPPRILPALLAAGLLLCASTRGADPKADPPKLDFQKYTSAAGKFTVLFPGKPKEQVQEIDTKGGKLKVVTTTVDPAPNLIYVVSVNDYPEDVAKTEPQALLKGVRDGNKGEDGKIVKDEEITLGKDKVPGREILIAKKTLYYRARLYLAGNRLYQLIVAGPKEAVTSKEADKFLDSFALTK